MRNIFRRLPKTPTPKSSSALGNVAKARGMAQIAKDAGLGRESLYKTLSTGAHPRFETINSVLHVLGVKFAVVAERES
jgi:probable addiction module antidote protein